MPGIEFDRIRGFLFDMDGVWFVGDTPVHRARDTLAHLRKRGIPMRFITNTTTRSLAQLEQKMHHLGLPVEREEIINSPQAAVLYLRAQGSPSCHLIVSENVKGNFAEFPTSGKPDYVVIGDVGDRWSYALLNEAFRMLMGGARLLAMHKGRYWQVKDGLRLDIGIFVAGLEYACGIEAVLVGKPAPLMFRSALEDLGLGAADAVMVGDDIRSDIGGAQAVGIPGVLVRTGKYREELAATADVRPDAIIDSVADLLELL